MVNASPPRIASASSLCRRDVAGVSPDGIIDVAILGSRAAQELEYPVEYFSVIKHHQLRGTAGTSPAGLAHSSSSCRRGIHICENILITIDVQSGKETNQWRAREVISCAQNAENNVLALEVMRGAKLETMHFSTEDPADLEPLTRAIGAFIDRTSAPLQSRLSPSEAHESTVTVAKLDDRFRSTSASESDQQEEPSVAISDAENTEVRRLRTAIEALDDKLRSGSLSKSAKKRLNKKKRDLIHHLNSDHARLIEQDARVAKVAGHLDARDRAGAKRSKQMQERIDFWESDSRAQKEKMRAMEEKHRLMVHDVHEKYVARIIAQDADLRQVLQEQNETNARELAESRARVEELLARVEELSNVDIRRAKAEARARIQEGILDDDKKMLERLTKRHDDSVDAGDLKMRQMRLRFKAERETFQAERPTKPTIERRSTGWHATTSRGKEGCKFKWFVMNEVSKPYTSKSNKVFRQSKTLVPGRRYRYAVSVVSASGVEGPLSDVSDDFEVDFVDTPREPSVMHVDGQYVRGSTVRMLGAAAYEWTKAGDDAWKRITLAPSLFTEIPKGSSAQFVVQAVGASGCRSPSSPLSPSVTAPPQRPTGVTVLHVEGGTVRVQCTHVAGATAYQWTFQQYGKRWKEWRQTQKPGANFFDFQPGARYRFAVRAQTADRTTSTVSLPSKVLLVPLGHAGQVRAEYRKAKKGKGTLGKRCIFVKCKQIKGAHVYAWQVRKVGGSVGWTKMMGSDMNRASRSDFTPGTSYEFRVRGVTRDGSAGPWTSTSEAVVLGLSDPKKVEARHKRDKCIELRASEVHGVCSYKWELRRVDGKSVAPMTWVGVSDKKTGFLKSDFGKGHSYQFRCCAVGRNGKTSNWSALTKPVKVPGFDLHALDSIDADPHGVGGAGGAAAGGDGDDDDDDDDLEIDETPYESIAWDARPAEKVKLFAAPDVSTKHLRAFVRAGKFKLMSKKTFPCRIAEHPFAKGSLRYAYHAQVKVGDEWEHRILKRFMKPKLKKDYEDAAKENVVAGILAAKWNKKAESGSKKIRYVSVGVAGVKKGKKKYEWYNWEGIVDGEWKKWSENAGIIADPDAPLLLKFSKWTHSETEGFLMVVDLQGCEKSGGYLLTDPAILCSNLSYFGDTNFSPSQMDQCLAVIEHALK